MREPLNYLSQVAQKARQEDIPTVDVSRNVLRAIRQVDNNSGNAFMIFAACSATAACVAIGYCFYLYTILTDPLSGYFQVMPTLMS